QGDALTVLVADVDLVDTVAPRAPHLGRFRRELITLTRAGQEVDRRRGGDRRVVVRVAREGEGTIAERKDDATVAHAVPVHHVRPHSHHDLRPAGAHGGEAHAESLRGAVPLIERGSGALGPLLRGVGRPAAGIAHGSLLGYQRPVKRGARFSLKAATPSA